MNTTRIEYVGKKALKKDTVAGTDIIWNGPGDVQDVPNKAVPLLLAHTDSWALAKGASAPAPAADTGKPAGDDSGDGKKPDGDGKNAMTEADAKPPMANLDAMDSKALRDYAQQHFGHAFHHNIGEAKMRQTIIGLMNRG